MKLSALKIHQPFAIALGLSFLIHLFFLKNIILVFTPKFSESRPSFVFLGPILKKINITKNPFGPSHKPPSENNPVDILSSSEISTVEPTIAKPHQNIRQRAKDKITIKTTFLENKSAKEASLPQKPDKLNLDFPEDTYQPLRFQLR